MGCDLGLRGGTVLVDDPAQGSLRGRQANASYAARETSRSPCCAAQLTVLCCRLTPRSSASRRDTSCISPHTIASTIGHTAHTPGPHPAAKRIPSAKLIAAGRTTPRNHTPLTRPDGISAPSGSDHRDQAVEDVAGFVFPFGGEYLHDPADAENPVHAGQRPAQAYAGRSRVDLLGGQRVGLSGSRTRAGSLTCDYAAGLYSLIKPPRTGLRMIRRAGRSGIASTGLGGRRCRLRWGRSVL